MLFPEEDAPLLKAWIVKRLETPSRSDSDVDADVLADYVLALLRHGADPDDVRNVCKTELYDFLKDEAAPFVEDVFAAVTYQAYRPGAAPAAPQAKTTAAPFRQQEPQQSGASFRQEPQQSSASFRQEPQQSGSRKRSYHESSLPTSSHGALSSGEAASPMDGRSVRQARRSGGGGGPFGLAGASPHVHTTAAPPLPIPGAGVYPAYSGTLTLPPVPPPLSLDPLAFGMPMGAGYAPHGGPGSDAPAAKQRRRRRCRYFDRQGYCTKPDCGFEHVPREDGAMGGGPVPQPPPPPHLALPLGLPPFPAAFPAMMSAEMMQQHQQMLLQQQQQMMQQMQQMMSPEPFQQQQQQQPQEPRPATRRKRNPHHGQRSRLSADGPAVYDPARTAIVVEGIPAEHLNEAAVRSFFAPFGAITSVDVQPRRRLAVVQFETWAAAQAAYQSPKVIFDNRFVKVYWRRAEGSDEGGRSPRHTLQGDDGEDEAVDMEALQRRQEEAQKLHEAKLQKKREVEQRRQELEQRQRALLAKQQEERQRLMAKMAAVAARVGASSSNSSSSGVSANGGTAKSAAAAAQTERIRAQLAALEEEAKLLGLDPDAMAGRGRGRHDEGESAGDLGAFSTPLATSPSWPLSRGGGGGRGPYRGGYRARGALAGRWASRGGRGGSSDGAADVHAAYAAYSLDNRPRRVAVTGVDFSAPGPSEALRQYLLGVGDFEAIDTTAAVTTITFADRRAAERFYYGLATAASAAPATAEPGAEKPPAPAAAAAQKWIPGVDMPVVLGWVAGTPPAKAGLTWETGTGTGSTATTGPSTRWSRSWNPAEGDAFMADDNDDKDNDHDAQRRQTGRRAVDEEGEVAEDDEEEEGEVVEDDYRRAPKSAMDFDVADEGDWDGM